MKINEATKCSTGPTTLWPEIKQCPNKPAQWLFGDSYCQTCYDALVSIHAKMNTTSYPTTPTKP